MRPPISRAELPSGTLARAALVALTTACAGAGEESAAPDESAAAVERVVRGHLVLGDGVRSLEPCGEDRALAVAPHAELADAYGRLSGGPGLPIFVEVSGSISGPEGGEFVVRSLRRAAPAPEGFGCAEDVSRFAFRAAGVEPFWNAEVGADGLTWTTPELPRTDFERVEPQAFGDGWVYETSSSGPDALTLRLELRRERCSDSMVGALYSWAATVEIAGSVREGCAWEGDQAPGG